MKKLSAITRMFSVYRVIVVVALMLTNGLHSFVASLLRRGISRRQRQIELTATYARLILRCLGYRVRDSSLKLPSGAFIVANHLSYVDILCIASVAPCVFVTSTEMRDSPIIGWLCKLGGSIFVNRRRHFVSRAELYEISQCLREGFRVVVFPEATSSDGSGVLPFKRGLFRAAQWMKAPVISLCLNYEEASADSLMGTTPQRVCFYGDETFGHHLYSLASSEPLVAEIQCVEVRLFEGTEDLRSMVSETRNQISYCFRPLAERNDSYWESPLPRLSVG